MGHSNVGPLICLVTLVIEIVNIREISFFIKKFFFPRIKSSNLTDWFESNMKILDSKEQNLHFVTNKKLIVITSGSYCDL